MKVLQVDCANCKTRLSVFLAEASVNSQCAVCGHEFWIEAFPALVKEVAAGQSGETLLDDEESSCFYHPAKKAIRPCDACGRFLCALCDIDVNGEHWCPACFEKGVKKGKKEHLKKENIYYDDIAVSVAIVPLLIFYLTLFTAPIALYIALRHWNTPLSAAPRGRWRFVVAIVFSVLEIAGWATGITMIFVMGT